MTQWERKEVPAIVFSPSERAVPEVGSAGLSLTTSQTKTCGRTKESPYSLSFSDTIHRVGLTKSRRSGEGKCQLYTANVNTSVSYLGVF